ncbi:tetratricopeptide repeat protein [Treponema primitia]|uniref:tetratricopeptide repeat protein n=1 Tax=Treponema primitia TaxID=88058 RepID=UPI0039805838
MSKYNLELEYVIPDVDINEDELQEIICEANHIIKNKDSDPETLLWAYVKKGQAIQESKNIDIEKSKPYFTKALKMCPDMLPALLGMGRIYESSYSKCQDDKKAFAYYNQAVNIMPNYPASYLELVRLYDQDDEERIVNCTKAISLKPDYAVAFWRRGYAHSFRGESDQAIADYTEAIRLKPNWSFMYNLRGNVYNYEKGDFDKAIADYTESIHINPDFSYNYKDRGYAYDKKGNKDDAITDFLHFINVGWEEGFEYRFGRKNTREHYESHYFKSDSIQDEINSDKQNMENKKAIENYNSILSVNPGDKYSLKKRAELYVQVEEYDLAIVDYSELLRLVEVSLVEISDKLESDVIELDAIIAYEKRGIVWHYKGEIDKAIADLSDSIYLSLKQECGGLGIYLHRSSLYAEKGEYDKAIMDIATGFRFYFPPGLVPYAFADRGLYYNRIGNYSKAIKDCTEAIRIMPDFSAAYRDRGEAYIGKHQYKKAIKDLDEAIRLDNQNASAYYFRGEAYRLSRKYKNALADYDEALKIEPDFIETIQKRELVYNKIT